jgi:hypothetical protein
MQSRPRTFLQVAGGMKYSDRSLVLEDLSPATIVLSDPHNGQVSHLRTSSFLDAWWEVHSAPASDAERATSPAVLTLLDGEPLHTGDVMLRVRDPRISGSGLRWTVDVIDGLLPPRSGSCLLCIDCSPDVVEPARHAAG